MSESADKILEGEIAKLGGAGGAVGGGVGGAIDGDGLSMGMGALGGASGGKLGGKLGAKLMKDTAHEDAVELDLSCEDALRQVVAALDQSGELHPTESDSPGARAVVNTGLMKMNPAVVDATVEPIGDNRTRVVLRAFAKEGRLVKQDIAEKAIDEVKSALRGESG